ncbi:MAG: flavin reductase family protein, partial [Planctomycetota bacterium]|nr:flavin reductase family protein [Planctomycetota bacterium]
MADGRREIHWTDRYVLVMDVLTDRGLLLVSGRERPNPMTIGWGAVGSIWGKPMWIVLVRPSRYTYGLIEETGDFTVNVPGRDLERACAVCGSVSGRETDKFAGCGLTAGKSAKVVSAFIEQCPIHYECRVVHANDI